MIFFRILLTIDIIAGAALLIFFAWGLVDGSAAYAPGMWLLLLAFVWGTIAGSIILQRGGNLRAGTVLLMPVAWPAIGYGLFVLAVLLLQPDWR
jgi:hypothetical protein